MEWGPCPDFIPAVCEIAILNGKPSKQNADIFFKVRGNFTISLHWHTSAERMLLVSGKLRVSYEGKPEVLMTRGSYAYGPARLPHKAYCLMGEACVLFIAFEQPIDAVATPAGSRR